MPVIDLRNRFALPQQSFHEDAHIIVVNLAGNNMGVIVDGVTEIIRICDEAIGKAPAITANINSNFLFGIAKSEKGLIIVLDLQHVLSTDEEKQLSELSVVV